ncbi:MAG: UDP-N-acetylmuramate--L-alanine ligase [Nitrospirae bacterium]|nr:UDP-N-acetylmuramate--L-alanine ligase [Nitrospirota bacterium]
MYRKFEIIHFVGIGGVGMSGIAEVLINLGYKVRGSDLKESETTKRLKSLGIGIAIGHKAENVRGAHVVVISSAVSSDNPEVAAARNESIPVIPRAEMLAELARLKYSVLVAGAHGKTTTTSLIAGVFASAGLDPTVVVGGKLTGMGSNARLGQGEFLVAEADESDGSFLKLSPTIAVVTNIDREHMDFFKGMDELKNAFLSFINKIPFYGVAVLCADNGNVRELLPKVQRRFMTYGLEKGLDLTAMNIERKGMRSKFEVILKGESLGFFEISLPGLHNIYNSLAAIGVANELGLDNNAVREALAGFSGVQRRFEFKGDVCGIRVFDDYGHHPAEVMATLRAAKETIAQNTENRIQKTETPPPFSARVDPNPQGKGRLVVLFQPHRYTRTRDLLAEFSGAFTDADKVILMDIYPAGEQPIEGINSELLFREIKKAGKDIIYVRERARILEYLIEELRDGDMFLTLGAGDVWKIGEEFVKVKMGRVKGQGVRGQKICLDPGP